MSENHGINTYIKLPVGQYTLGGCLHLGMSVKPKWLHRQCMRTFFGIVWTDGIHPDAVQALAAQVQPPTLRPSGVNLQ